MNKIKKRPIYSTSGRRAVRLRPIQRAGWGGGGGGGGGGGCPRKTVCKKKVFWTKGPRGCTPQPPVSAPGNLSIGTNTLAEKKN